jgi:MFS family permease
MTESAGMEAGTLQPDVEVLPEDRRAFFALLATSFFSIAGNAFTMLAIPLYVLSTTGSATKTGIVAFVNTAPPIISAILGGAAIDRVGRRRIILASDALSMLTVGAIPLLDSLDQLTFPILLVLVALGSFLDAPGSTARQSMLPMLATKAGYSPERAQSMFSVSFGLSQIIGPSLAGICIAAIGAAGTIWINCATFAISILLVGLLINDRQAFAIQGTRSNYLDDLKIGWRFVWNDDFMRAIMITGAAFSAIFYPIYTVLYPVYFTEIVESTRGLGFFVGVESLGALIGAVVYGIVGERVSRWKAMIFCLIAWLPTYWVLVFHPPLWALLIAGFAAGLLTGPLQPIFNVAFQIRTPEDLRPRVYGLTMAANLIAVPLGALLIGPAIEWLGVINALTVLAAVVSVLCIWCAFIPVFRELDHPLEEYTVDQAPS